MQKSYFTLLLFLTVQFAFGQFFSDKNDIKRYDGFIPYYYDISTDKIYLEVTDVNKEFIYVGSLSQGVGSNDLGLDRGQLGNTVVVKFQRAGNKLLLVQPNQKYRAITSNIEEKKSVQEAFAKSVLHGFKIEDQKNGKFLVDATSFFLRDEHQIANKLAKSKQGNYRLDLSKSAFNMERTKGFPKNVEFDVLLTFAGNAKGKQIKSVSPNPNLVSVYQHHSFVELPDDGYKKRIYDPRSGSFSMSYYDYATPVDESLIKRFIYRHRLEKKNPNAKVSEAVEPIVYYLDRGAPEPIKSALIEGASWWNEAFESIGYKNAFQVKLLPAHADPMDLRYNVIQWVHRSTRGWSYGASVSDPRTGEILKGHVSLGSLRIRQDFLIAQALQAPYKTSDTDDKFALEMALARIRQLSAHEVGHTLGFAHNFAASTTNRASVMDYPHMQIKLKRNKIDFSDAYAVGIGNWDKVTVGYAYGDFGANEDAKLHAFLDDKFKEGYRYISDPDARPKGSAHTYAHLWDNGNDITKELEDVLKIRKKGIENFSEDNIKSNQPYSVLEDVFVPLYFFHRYQTEAVSKVIGGLDYTYAVKNGGGLVVDRVEGKKERNALASVLKTINVNTIAIPKEKLSLFPPRAYGYNRTRESFKSKNGVAFDPYGAVDTASEMTLSLLLNPQRASRLVQHKSMDDSQLGLDEMIDEIIANSFQKTHKDAYYQELQNVVNSQVLNQLFYLAANQKVYMQVRAIALSKIDEISRLLQQRKSSGVQKMYDKELVNSILEFEKNPSVYKKTVAPKIPDGSPIGMH